MGGCIPGKTKIQINKLNVNNNIENKNIKNIMNNNSFNNNVKENNNNNNNNFFSCEDNNFFNIKQKSINNNFSSNNLMCPQPQMILINNNKFIINTSTNNTNDISNENDEKLLKSIEIEKNKQLSCNNILTLKHNPTIFHESVNSNLFEQKSLKTKGPILSKLEKYSKKIKKKEIN